MTSTNIWSAGSRLDLVIGLIGVVLALAVGADWWLALLVGIVAYAVTTFIRRRAGGDAGGVSDGERARLAYEASGTKVETLRQLATRVSNPNAREIALRISTHAETALVAMADERRQAAAPLLLEHVLEPVEGVLETYLHVAERGVAGTESVLHRAEAFELPTIERAARAFAERLTRDESVDLVALEQTLAFNLETTQIVQPPARQSSPSADSGS